jgi:hypothetical protein
MGHAMGLAAASSIVMLGVSLVFSTRTRVWATRAFAADRKREHTERLLELEREKSSLHEKRAETYRAYLIEWQRSYHELFRKMNGREPEPKLSREESFAGAQEPR